MELERSERGESVRAVLRLPSAEPRRSAVRLIRRIALLPPGVIAVVLGVLSPIVAIALIFMGFSEIGDPGAP